eukprot:6449120-Amphidinium_carterae.1
MTRRNKHQGARQVRGVKTGGATGEDNREPRVLVAWSARRVPTYAGTTLALKHKTHTAIRTQIQKFLLTDLSVQASDLL